MKRNAIVIASIVAALLAVGCGKHTDTQALGDASTTQPAGFDPASATAAAQPAAARMEGGAPAVSEGAPTVESLPPDLSVSAPDSALAPGAAIELIARGTPDVVEVTLWDGVGQKQPMSYDPEGKVWKAYYRVPLRFSVERVALSLTAKNGANKWRRVWVSLRVQHPGVESRPDTTSGS